MSRFPLRPPRRCSRLVIALLVAIGGLGWPTTTRAEVLPLASGLFSDAVLVEGTSWLALLEARWEPPWETPRRLTLADLDQRQPARVVALPADRRRLAADPARQRLYATADTFSPVSPTVAIYDLGTGAVRTVTVAEPDQWLGPPVVNAATGRVYFPVWSQNARGRTVFAGTRVLDGEGRPVARLPVRVLAADPGANLLYAAEYLPSSTPEFYANEGLRLVVLDGQTERRAPGSGERTYDRLTNVGATLLVHRRAQTLLLSISFYSAKAGHLPLQLLDGRALTPIPFTSGAPNIDLPFAVNEATNRAYGPTGAYQPATPFIDSFDARTGALVARWHTNAGVLIAVDSQRNRLVLCRCDSRERALVIADGQTETVSRVIPLDPTPDPAPTRPVAPPPAGADARYFPETGHTLRGGFRRFWEERGGLAIFGYPLTEEIAGTTRDARGATPPVTVQYFERARFEYHAALAGTPGEVQLDLLGIQFAALRAPTAPGPDGGCQPSWDCVVAAPDRLWFSRTGHAVAYGFKTFWERQGGLTIFGYPITGEFSQVSPTDGRVYTVQYFERARFEYHPELAGTPHEVQLGQLGRQTLAAHGQPPPTP